MLASTFSNFLNQEVILKVNKVYETAPLKSFSILIFYHLASALCLLCPLSLMLSYVCMPRTHLPTLVCLSVCRHPPWKQWSMFVSVPFV